MARSGLIPSNATQVALYKSVCKKYKCK